MRVLVERIESWDVGRSRAREDMGEGCGRHNRRGAVGIPTGLSVSLEYSEHPWVMLDRAVNGSRGRGGIHAVHPILVKLVRIPHLVNM